MILQIFCWENPATKETTWHNSLHSTRRSEDRTRKEMSYWVMLRFPSSLVFLAARDAICERTGALPLTWSTAIPIHNHWIRNGERVWYIRATPFNISVWNCCPQTCLLIPFWTDSALFPQSPVYGEVYYWLFKKMLSKVLTLKLSPLVLVTGTWL